MAREDFRHLAHNRQLQFDLLRRHNVKLNTELCSNEVYLQNGPRVEEIFRRGYKLCIFNIRFMAYVCLT